MINYLIINILIIIFPLLFSFEKRIRYYKNFKPLFLSILFVGICYIIWDVVATYRGDWWFNHDYVMGFEIAGLPIEEILFFITAPYSCIFIYESLVYFLNDSEFNLNSRVFIVPSLIFLVAGSMFYNQYYTATVLFSCSLFFFLAMLVYPKMLISVIYWLYIVIVFIPFFIMNYLLTSIPIVLYSPDAIWNIRITTIPAEDFFYNFAMLSFYLMVYLIFKSRFNKNVLSR
jgi:lycopene cyclase domain-containing protein